MKKNLLLICIFVFTISISNAQVTIYDTTHASGNGAEITGTANGIATSFGDAIQLSGTERLLDIITVNLFNLTDTSDFDLTMTLYTDCPTLVGTAACGSGIGTLIPFSETTITVTAPPITGQFTADFEFGGSLDITDFSADNTITVMLRASRNNVFWIINETPVIGSLPAGDTALSTLTRCGSVLANNACTRTFTAPIINNVGMRITAFPGLNTNQYLANKFSVYPNPANNFVTISANDLNINSIELSDINGRVIKNISTIGSQVEVNISDLAQGVYMMKISSNEGIATKKIVKE